MIDRDFDPLFGNPLEEIPLANAPLAAVVAQVQFAPILQIRSEDYVAPFQERIRSEYPDVQQEKIQFMSSFGGNADAKEEIIWRFLCSEPLSRVSLTSASIALETRAYTSRTDFIGRFKAIVAALKDTVGSARVARIGVRYVDHVRSPQVDDMAKMLRHEMMGIANTSLRGKMKHAVSELSCEVAEGELLARWGFLPPNGTHDLNVMAPVNATSWFLDIDVFKQYGGALNELDADTVHATAFALATRAYALFRWATTDQFLEAYGGRK